MATKPQRLKSALESIRNNPVTAAEMTRVTAAFVARYAPDAAGLTDAEKAAVVLRALQMFIRGTVSAAEISDAQRQAAASHVEIDIGAD